MFADKLNATCGSIYNNDDLTTEQKFQQIQAIIFVTEAILCPMFKHINSRFDRFEFLLKAKTEYWRNGYKVWK